MPLSTTRRLIQAKIPSFLLTAGSKLPADEQKSDDVPKKPLETPSFKSPQNKTEQKTPSNLPRKKLWTRGSSWLTKPSSGLKIIRAPSKLSSAPTAAFASVASAGEEKLTIEFDLEKFTERCKNLLKNAPAVQKHLLEEVLPKLKKDIEQVNLLLDNIEYQQEPIKTLLRTIHNNYCDTGAFSGLQQLHNRLGLSIAGGILKPIAWQCQKLVQVLDKPLLEKERQKKAWLDKQFQAAERVLSEEVGTLTVKKDTALPESINEIACQMGKYLRDVDCSVPQGCYFVYGWSLEEHAARESWVQDCLRLLKSHLEHAGITTVHLDVESNPLGGAVKTYMEQTQTDEYVLMIGTQSALDKQKYTNGTAAICTEIILGKRKRAEDIKHGLQRVFPILLTHDMERSFPPEYEGFNTIRDWRIAGYLENLKELIFALYGLDKQKFYKSYLKKWEELETQSPHYEIIQRFKQDFQTKRSTVKESKSPGTAISEEKTLAQQWTGLNRSLSQRQHNLFDDSEATALRTTYQTNIAITRLFYPHHPLALDDIYINLAIIKEKAQQEERETKHYIPDGKEEKKKERISHPYHKRSGPYDKIYGDREIFTLDKIFEQMAGFAAPQRQLIIGQAGIGKSTLCRYIANQWARKKLWSDRYNWLFWLPLRNLADTTRYPARKEPYTLTDVLKREYLPQASYEEVNGWLAELIGKKDKVLWLLDGYDEIASLDEKNSSSMRSIVDSLLDSRQWPHLLLTSRPYSLPTIVFDRRLEVMGFTPENINAYIDKFFISFKALGAEDKKSDTNDTLKQLLIKNPNIQGAARIPINLELICSVWERQGKIQAPEEGLTMTALYQQMLEQLLRRYLREQHHNKDKLTSNQVLTHPHCLPVLTFLEELAYRGMQEPSIVLPNRLITEIYESCCQRYPDVKNLFDWILQTGFIKPTVEGPGDIQNDCYFIHLSFQEFFAARYFATGLQIPDSQYYREAICTLQTQKYNNDYAIVWEFLSGLLSMDLAKSAPLIGFWNTLDTLPLDLVGKRHIYLLIRCLEESQCDRRIPQLEHYWPILKKIYDARSFRTSIWRTNPRVANTVTFSPLPKLDLKFKTTLADLKNTDESVRIKAVSTLRGLTAHPDVQDALVAMLSDENEVVRFEAVEALRYRWSIPAWMIAPAAPKSSVLKGLLEVVVGEDALNGYPETGEIRMVAAYTICYLGGAGVAATPEMIAALAGAYGKADEYIADYLRVQKDDMFMMSSATTYILDNLEIAAAKPDVLKALTNTLINPSAEQMTRNYAAMALGKLGTVVAATPDILKTLIVALRDENQNIRYAAAFAFYNIKEPAAKPEVLEALVTTLDDKSDNVRGCAATALGKLSLAATTPVVLNALIKLSLLDPDEGVRGDANNSLEELERSGAALKILKAMQSFHEKTDKKEEKVSARITTILGHLNSDTLDILSAINSPLQRMRELAISALGQMSAAAAKPEILTALVAILNDKEQKLKPAVLNALEKIGAAAATLPVVTALITLFNSESYNRVLILREASEMPKDDPYQATTIYLIITRDSNSQEKLEAWWYEDAKQCKENFWLENTKNLLASLPKFTEKMVAINKSDNLELVNKITALCGYNKQEKNLKVAVINTLGQIGATAITSEVFSMLLTAFNSDDSQIMRAAHDALGKIDTSVVAKYEITLAEALLMGKYEGIQSAASKALARMNDFSKLKISTLLLEALNNKDKKIKFRAAYLLGEMGNTVATYEVITALLAFLQTGLDSSDKYSKSTLDKLNFSAATLKQLSDHEVAILAQHEINLMGTPLAEMIETYLTTGCSHWAALIAKHAIEEETAITLTNTHFVIYNSHTIIPISIPPGERTALIAELLQAFATQAKKLGLPDEHYGLYLQKENDDAFNKTASTDVPPETKTEAIATKTEMLLAGGMGIGIASSPATLPKVAPAITSPSIKRG